MMHATSISKGGVEIYDTSPMWFHYVVFLHLVTSKFYETVFSHLETVCFHRKPSNIRLVPFCLVLGANALMGRFQI